ncbi:MAG: type ISP restriction/modification enzyme [Pseudanabaena sp.]|jgi:predicted helicase
MKKAQIYYARMDEFWRKEQKLSCLEKFESLQDVDWKEVKPDSKYTWLTEGSELDFEQFISIGNRSAKSSSEENQEVIFKLFSLGVSTNRDIWVRNFDVDVLANNIRKTIEAYNQQVSKWLNREDKAANVDGFVIYDDVGISWSSTLKNQLKRGTICKYTSDHVRKSIYRPFCSQFLYFNEILNDRRGQFPLIFPVPETEKENLTIWLKIGSEIPMYALAIKCIPDLLPQGGSQCFPFYIYDKDGTNRRENITDWALEKFQTHYQDPKITKWDIFHYTYALLHHPHYRQRYAANLKRELPRIPFAPEFHPFAISGKRLTEIHINYEQQPEYRLKHIENKDLPIDWRVEKMRLSKDKTQIKYNDFLTLTGIPPETFEYKLGNRSALDWIIDQYQVSTDKRSGITNDPNRLDEEEYIVRLIKQVITVSLETVKIVKGLPDLGLPKD